MKLTSRLMIFLITVLMLDVMTVPMPFTAQAGGQDSKLNVQELTEPLTLQSETSLIGQRLKLDFRALTGELADPFLLPQQQGTPIACDETKQGMIEQSDPTSQNSQTHFDLYTFTTQQSNQPFIITLKPTTNNIITSELVFFDQQQNQTVFLQGGYAPSNKEVKHIGVLTSAGQYAIFVYGIDTQQGFGSYSLKLECKPCGAAPPNGACSGGGSPENAVQIQYDQQLTCDLSANDAQLRDQQGGIHFAKIFTLQAQAGTTRVEVSSQAFTPLIGVLDPTTGSLSNINVSPNNLSFQAGQAFFVVTSNETQTTGSFTVKITKGGSPF
ncbi:MAG: hypothetical protein HY314_13240 [Acidobacteria bacterium]|nr:hypothetical protein [Acidobacteriota bacterium]